MCIGVPGKIVSIRGKEAKIKQGGHFHWVGISSLQEKVKMGDYLITYQDTAINKVLPKEAEEILKLMDGACDAGIKRSN